MGNLKNPKAIWFKCGLFVLLGGLASGILLARSFNLPTLVLLLIAIWSFCRAYYFAFYVIEHYVDSSYRFAGLIDFARYALHGAKPDHQESSEP